MLPFSLSHEGGTIDLDNVSSIILVYSLELTNIRERLLCDWKKKAKQSHFRLNGEGCID